MMNRYCMSAVAVLLTVAAASAQLRVLKIEQLPVETTKRWTQPQYSPDGISVFFTSADFGGIWQYTFPTRATQQLVADPGAGANFKIAPDGKKLVYRRTTSAATPAERQQEIILRDLAEKTVTIIATAPSLSVPSFVDGKVVFTEAGKTKNLPLKKTSAANVTLLGLEDNKIAYSKYGVKVLLDPLGTGRYIWPSLSPDKDKIVAYQMEQGTFTCDLDGKNIRMLGRRDAPQWTRDGKWIAYMDDKDDGHRITTSDIWMVRPDSSQIVQLTATPKIGEMYPSCSPTENKIVCSSLDGRLYVISYSEDKK